MKNVLFPWTCSVLPWTLATTLCLDMLQPNALGAASSTLDWPHLRGPDLSGVSTETNLVESWPVSGPPMCWRRELGQGYSGFVAVAQRLYTQAQSHAGQFVICLDADTGRTIWLHRYGWPWQPNGDYPGPYATPTVRNGRIYFAGTDGLVGCLNIESGKRVWTLNVSKKFHGRGTEFGYACTPLVEDGKVILPVGGPGAGVVALNAADGSVAWTSGDEPASYCSAYPITLGGRRQVVAFLQNSVTGFDLKTGKQLWRYQSSEGYDEHAAWPLYREPHLLIFAPFRGGAKMLRLEDQGGKISVRVAWENEKLSNDILSSILLNGYVYGFDIRDYQANGDAPSHGEFKCMKFSTGEVLWATDRTGHATVIAGDGKLIIFNDAGTLILASAAPDRYQELCRAQIFREGPCWTVPLLRGARLYLRNQREAVCLHLGPERRQALRTQEQRDGSGWQPAGSALSSWAVWRKARSAAPETGELVVWYLASLFGVFAVSSLLSADVFSTSALSGDARRRRRTIFWLTSFVFGVLGTFVFSYLREAFVFTWPASLFAAYQLTLQLAVEAERRPKKYRWTSRIAGLIFFGICGFYFYFCRVLFIVLGWGFFIGLLAAWPFSVYAARRLATERRPAWNLLWLVVAFSVYFWASGLFTIWRMNCGL